VAERKYYYGSVEPERTETAREADAAASERCETADNGLPFLVDGQADLTEAASKISVIANSQQKLQNSVN
jgi:hypothetical protein